MSSGKRPRRSGKKTGQTKADAPGGRSDRKIYAVIALVVGVLGALVWWSLPSEFTPSAEAPSDEVTTTETDARAPVGLPGLGEATTEFAILTTMPKEAVQPIATASEIARRLEPRHCGGACDAVKKLVNDEHAFEVEIRETSDLLLPPKATFDTVASGLTPKERDNVDDHATAVIVRTSGNATADQLPARAGFAVTSLLADAFDGFVYDEVARRIETRREADAQVITAPLGSRVFNRRQIVVQLFRDEDGTARLGTLGMARFGTVDLALRGANMGSGPLLAEVVNAAASALANGHAEGRITITLDDIARVVGKTPAELSTDPKASRPVTLDIVRPDRIEGDPDNDMGELVPPGGSSREAWEAVVTSLFGTPSSLRTSASDKELADIASKARRELPSAIKRFQAGEGALFVKGPFTIPTDFRADGGPASELLWVEVASCDAERCTGVLANDPSYASNIALGKTTSVLHRDVADWLIQRRDGRTVGGESIKVLKARAAK